jgi:hypothetical protein
VIFQGFPFPMHNYLCDLLYCFILRFDLIVVYSIEQNKRINSEMKFNNFVYFKGDVKEFNEHITNMILLIT